LRLGHVRLQAIRTRRQLSQIRALFHHMETREDVESETLLSAMRKLAQKFDALDYEFSAIYERARLLQDEIAGRMTAVTNRRLFTLSVLTACMLPSTLVTGFFGMNTKDMPFQNGDGGTWYALLLVIAAGALTYGCSGAPRRCRPSLHRGIYGSKAAAKCPPLCTSGLNSLPFRGGGKRARLRSISAR
jgi:zinc transporter